MTARVCVIGVDPGPRPGIALLTPTSSSGVRFEVVQCSAGAAVFLVTQLAAHAEFPVLLAVERFVVRGRAGCSSSPQAGQTTRDLIGALTDLQGRRTSGVTRVVLRSASEVKPWSSDERLAAVGLLDATKGMPHARDGCRHALFSAVHDCGFPDPLSTRYRSPTGA